MKILLQRVSEASVTVNNECIGRINRGLLLFIGFGKNDTTLDFAAVAEKMINLRVFPDEQGRFQHSLQDIDGEILAIPQFTLYGETRKGRRPDFTSAKAPAEASELFDHCIEALHQTRIKTASGRFGADMQIALINDGPVTLMLEW